MGDAGGGRRDHELGSEPVHSSARYVEMARLIRGRQFGFALTVVVLVRFRRQVTASAVASRIDQFPKRANIRIIGLADGEAG